MGDDYELGMDKIAEYMAQNMWTTPDDPSEPKEEPMSLSKFIDNHNIGIDLVALAKEPALAAATHRAVFIKAGRVAVCVYRGGAGLSKSSMFKHWYQSPAVSQETVRRFLGSKCYNALCKNRGLVAGAGRRQPKAADSDALPTF